jgi:hypothetical protein
VILFLRPLVSCTLPVIGIPGSQILCAGLPTLRDFLDAAAAYRIAFDDPAMTTVELQKLKDNAPHLTSRVSRPIAMLGLWSVGLHFNCGFSALFSGRWKHYRGVGLPLGVLRSFMALDYHPGRWPPYSLGNFISCVLSCVWELPVAALRLTPWLLLCPFASDPYAHMRAFQWFGCLVCLELTGLARHLYLSEPCNTDDLLDATSATSCIPVIRQPRTSSSIAPSS